MNALFVYFRVKLSPNVLPAQFLISGNGANHGQTRHLAPAILYEMEHIRSYLMDLSTLHQETGRSAEETCIQVCTNFLYFYFLNLY